MDRGWFIGKERISPEKSQQQTSSSSSSNISRPCVTVNLTEMLRAESSCVERKPIPIRPPSPRPFVPRKEDLRHSHSFEPAPKPIIQQRSHSLPPPTGKKKHHRHVGVRFVDSLGLELENVRFFKSGDEPLVPEHVTFRLMMAAEMADGRHSEISLPYLMPVFAQQPGDNPGFLHRLQKQKVCLERVLCFELGIIGITQVLNLDFEKDVTARYSFTEWRSSTDTKASWVSTTWEGEGRQLSCDKFRFHLPVPPFLRPGAVLEFAIQYKVCGAEYWDNNNGDNYKLVCQNYKLTVPKECEDSMVHFT